MLECSVYFEGENGDLITSEPLVVRITPFTKVKGVLFWLVLLPLLLLKENRSRKVLWAFLPFAAWLGIAFGIEYGVGLPSEILVPVPMILCGLFLAGVRFQRWPGWVSLLVAVLFAALFHGVWMWMGNPENLPYSAIVSGMLCLLVLVSLVLARLACRGKYSAVKFSLVLLPVVLVVTVVLVFVSGLLIALTQGELASAFEAEFLLAMMVPIAMAGLMIYGMLMSFLLVPFLSEFHRDRLCALLKLKRATPLASEPPPMPSTPS